MGCVEATISNSRDNKLKVSVDNATVDQFNKIVKALKFVDEEIIISAYHITTKNKKE